MVSPVTDNSTVCSKARSGQQPRRHQGSALSGWPLESNPCKAENVSMSWRRNVSSAKTGACQGETTLHFSYWLRPYPHNLRQDACHCGKNLLYFFRHLHRLRKCHETHAKRQRMVRRWLQIVLAFCKCFIRSYRDGFAIIKFMPSMLSIVMTFYKRAIMFPVKCKCVV